MSITDNLAKLELYLERNSFLIEWFLWLNKKGNEPIDHDTWRECALGQFLLSIGVVVTHGIGFKEPIQFLLLSGVIDYEFYDLLEDHGDNQFKTHEELASYILTTRMSTQQFAIAVDRLKFEK